MLLHGNSFLDLYKELDIQRKDVAINKNKSWNFHTDLL